MAGGERAFGTDTGFAKGGGEFPRHFQQPVFQHVFHLHFHHAGVGRIRGVPALLKHVFHGALPAGDEPEYGMGGFAGLDDQMGTHRAELLQELERALIGPEILAGEHAVPADERHHAQVSAGESARGGGAGYVNVVFVVGGAQVQVGHSRQREILQDIVFHPAALLIDALRGQQ